MMRTNKRFRNENKLNIDPYRLHWNRRFFLYDFCFSSSTFRKHSFFLLYLKIRAYSISVARLPWLSVSVCSRALITHARTHSSYPTQCAVIGTDQHSRILCCSAADRDEPTHNIVNDEKFRHSTFQGPKMCLPSRLCSSKRTNKFRKSEKKSVANQINR